MSKVSNKVKNSYAYLLLSLSSAMLATQAHAIEPVFKEVSLVSGIAYQIENNNMSGGIGWIDFDNDTYPDLYITNDTGPNRLYHNNKNGNFIEIANTAGVQLSLKKSLSVAVGDYNGDGFDDIFVGNREGNSLLKNNADGTFSDVTVSAGLNDFYKPGFAASFGDVNSDGYLDLYIGYWDISAVPCAETDLYLNNGQGGFTNVSVESGSNFSACVFSVPMTDFDQDGDLDIFLPNDILSLAPNELLRNDGNNSNGVPMFTPVAANIGLGDPISGMGMAIGDIDNDGDIDFYRTAIGPGFLSINDGTNNYTDSPVPVNGVGWGAAFFDANNDGYLDLYRSNSGFAFGQGAQENIFYLNNGNGTFPSTDSASITTRNVGLTGINAGLGLAYADYDKDGDVDVVTHGADGTINLFRNDTPAKNYLSIALKGSQLNHRGIGARVFSTSTDGISVLRQMREIHAGSSHSSNNDAGVHFGLASHTTVDLIKVIWPDGCVQKKRDIAANQVLVIDRKNCSETHTLSGFVIDSSGFPVVGQPVNINDNSGFTSTVITNARGEYIQTVKNSVYIVFMNSLAYDFQAVNNSSVLITVDGENEIKNYIATPRLYTVSGVILGSAGEPVAGVSVQINDNSGFTSSLLTDVNGVYTQKVPNGIYLIYLTSNIYNFTAIDSNPLVLVDANKIRNYTATVK